MTTLDLEAAIASAPTLVVFKGIRFRRYRAAKSRTSRVYFTPGIADRQRGIASLHVEVWKSVNGEVPDGFHVHHADFNPLNNDASNLIALSPEDHFAEHRANDPAFAAWHDSAVQNLAAIRPLASAWHRSAEGRAWHSEHARRIAAARTTRDRVCVHCEQPFVSINPAEYCSPPCKSAARRASRVDDETRACEHCESKFVVNRYARKRFCTRSCASLHQHEQHRIAA